MLQESVDSLIDIEERPLLDSIAHKSLSDIIEGKTVD